MGQLLLFLRIRANSATRGGSMPSGPPPEHVQVFLRQPRPTITSLTAVNTAYDAGTIGHYRARVTWETEP
jgi:hypothetical protein